ncbi:MAG TPA: hypothetical protein VFF71_02275 [Luteimonas sp.]|nr:hypothetical protein [Luteimonas sp.]
MDEIDQAVDLAAKAFRETATLLNNTLLVKLQTISPDILAKAGQALEAGERLELLVQFETSSSTIVFRTVDDYERAKILWTIPGRMPSLN